MLLILLYISPRTMERGREEYFQPRFVMGLFVIVDRTLRGLGGGRGKWCRWSHNFGTISQIVGEVPCVGEKEGCRRMEVEEDRGEDSTMF
jgi:hypothetical protein